MRTLKVISRCAAVPLYALAASASFGVMDGFAVFKNPAALTVQCLLLCVLYAFAFLAFNRVIAAAAVVSGAVWVVCLLNFYRMLLSSLPFRPIDLAMTGKAAGIFAFVSFKVEPQAVGSLALLAASTIAFCVAFGGLRLTLRTRMAAFSGLLAVYLVVFDSGIYRSAMSGVGSRSAVGGSSGGEMADSYRANGAVLGFFDALNMLETEKPKTFTYAPGSGKTPSVEMTDWLENGVYGEELMGNITDYLRELYGGGGKEAAEGGVKPNVVVIMSEAFTDPTLWGERVSFSKDPAPNLHRLQNDPKAATGVVYVPAFGGGTCDTEFECLSGVSFEFITSGDSPFLNYSQYFGEEATYALPNVFKADGYETLGLHTHFTRDKPVYERDYIYEKLGFDRLIGREDIVGDDEDASNPLFKGSFPKAGGNGIIPIVSDETMTDIIIDNLKEHEKGEPLFMYAVSMQNHGNYFRGRYFPADLLTIDVECSGFSEGNKIAAMTYAQGVFDADKQLGRLIEYAGSSSRPTLIFFFGDHQPLVGDYNEVFERMGYLRHTNSADWTLDEFAAMHQTPYVMWANYDLPNADMGGMSASFIGANVLNAAGVTPNYRFAFLSGAFNDISGMLKLGDGLFFDKEGRYSREPSADYAAAVEAAKWIDYDLLYGEGYAKPFLSGLTD